MREHIRDVSFPCLVTLAKFAEVRRLLKECSAHLQQQCASVERGGGQFGACLRSVQRSMAVLPMLCFWCDVSVTTGLLTFRQLQPQWRMNSGNR